MKLNNTKQLIKTNSKKNLRSKAILYSGIRLVTLNEVSSSNCSSNLWSLDVGSHPNCVLYNLFGDPMGIRLDCLVAMWKEVLDAKIILMDTNMLWLPPKADVQNFKWYSFVAWWPSRYNLPKEKEKNGHRRNFSIYRCHLNVEKKIYSYSNRELSLTCTFKI